MGPSLGILAYPHEQGGQGGKLLMGQCHHRILDIISHLFFYFFIFFGFRSVEVWQELQIEVDELPAA